MYQIKLKNKAVSTIVRNACRMACGITLFLATACGKEEPALTDDQKLALDFYAYENDLTGVCPLKGDKAIEYIKRANQNNKAFNEFIEANKANLKILTAKDFIKQDLKDKTVCYILGSIQFIKLESSKPANTGIRVTDKIQYRNIDKWEFITYTKQAHNKFNEIETA